MKTRFALSIALAAWAGAGAPAPTRVPQSEPLLGLAHVNVIDVRTGAVLPDRTLLMEHGRISAVLANNARRPRAFRIIDAHGGYAIPGLWDSHVHLTDASLTDAAVEGPAFLAAGVTSVRDMGGNLSVMDTLRALETEGQIAGPHIIAAGPFIDGPKEGVADRVTIESPQQALAAIAALKAEGVDFIKIHNGVSRPVFLSVVAAARRAGLPVAVHLAHSVTAEEAADAGVSTLEHTETLMESGFRSLHLDGKSTEEGREALAFEVRGGTDSLIAKMRRNHVCFTPTLTEYRSFAGLSSQGYPVASPKVVPPTLAAFWDKYYAPEADAERRYQVRQRIFESFFGVVRAMNAKGVPIMAGTDLGARDIFPGYSLHEELALLSRAGLSNLEVLQSATLNPARCMGLTKDYGALEAGHVADIVVLDRNPLLDLTTLGKPQIVIAHGRTFETKTPPSGPRS
jgi:imidazolonepropionase-like amidohydrolase